MKISSSTALRSIAASLVAGLFLFSASAGLSAPIVQVQTYSTAGTTSFLDPFGVFNIQVETWGGGGAGGAGRKDTAAGSNTSQNGGGGGGGAYARTNSVPVTFLQGYTIIIPVAAVSGINGTTTNNAGNVNGGAVTFVGDSGVTTTAAGGTGGRNAYTTVNGTTADAGGAGGTIAASVGDVKFAGGAGAAGTTGATNYSGGGGGGAGNAGAGVGASADIAGAGGSVGGGAGGNGRAGGNTNPGVGANGTSPGGGGGGGHNQGISTRLGGTGGLGQVTLTYYLPLSWKTGDGTWDTTAPDNWLDLSNPTVSTAYTDNLTPVLFDDAAGVTGNPTVTLNSTVSPLGVTISSTSHDYTIIGSGAISGSTQLLLAPTNTRTLTLGTANTYTGATTISGGAVNLTGSLDGTAITVGGTAVLSESSTGVISGAASLAHSSTGISTLAGANHYTGVTTISAGTVNLTGSLDATAITVRGTAVLSESSTGVISGAASLTHSSTGISTLAGANHYTGATTISGGTVNLTGSLDATAITVSGTAVLSESSTGFISGGASLAHSSSGTSTLAGANTYNGTTAVNAGTLALAFGAVSSNILSSSSPLTLGGGVLQLTGTGTQTVAGLTTTASTASRILLAANETLTLGALTSAGANSALNFNTTAGGANATTSAVGTSRVVLTGQTAGTVINSGFTVTDSGGFGLATVNGSDQVIRRTTTPLLPTTGATSATDYRIDNNAGGSGAAGSSTLTTDTASQSALSITVDTTAANGVLTLGAGLTLSNNTWNFGGGSKTYQITGGTGVNSVSTDDTIAINNYNAGAVTFASPIVANGANAVVVNGTGTTVFTGSNTYTGATTISGGTLQIGGSGTLNSGVYTGAIAIAAGATLQYSSSADQTLSTGVISGSGSIIKDISGTSTLTLAGANTYTGMTTISAGILKIGNVAALGAGTGVADGTTISSGATLDLGGIGIPNANTSAERITASGTGVGGNGAIISSTAIPTPFIGVRYLTLAGATTLGFSNRWDVGSNTGAASALVGNGNALTFLGTAAAAQASLNFLGETDLGDINVNLGLK